MTPKRSSSFPRLYRPQTAEDLLTEAILGKLMLGFTAALKMSTAMEDRSGKRYNTFGDPAQHYCDFCKRFRLELGLDEKCKDWDAKVAKELLDESGKYADAKLKYREPFVCHAGMWDIAEVIHLEGRPFAVLHGGQIRPDYPGWQEYMRSRLEVLLPGQEQVVQSLVSLVEEMPSEKNPKDRHETFRAFAKEVEVLLGRLYQQRLAASEESFLKAVVEALTENPVVDWAKWWTNLDMVMEEIAVNCGLSRALLLLSSSEKSLFELQVKASSKPSTSFPTTFNVGPYWQAIRYQPPMLVTGQRWAKDLRKTVGLQPDEPCALVAFQSRAEAPDTESPGLLLCAGPEVQTPSVLPFLEKLAGEISRRITAISNSFQLKEVIEKASLSAAYSAHDVKFPLHAAFGLAERIAFGMRRAKVKDVELLGQTDQLLESLEEAKTKTKLLEQLPIRDLVVECLLEAQDIIPLLDRTIKLARGLRPEKMVAVNWVERPAAPVFVEIDEAYLSTAFHAIFENAVKYSFKDKEVRVSAKVEGEWLQIRISDYGVGIPPNMQLRLFEFGERAKVEETHNQDDRSGGGRGLAIAKRIILAHHGDLWLNSRATVEDASDDEIALRHEVVACLKLPFSKQQ